MIKRINIARERCIYDLANRWTKLLNKDGKIKNFYSSSEFRRVFNGYVRILEKSTNTELGNLYKRELLGNPSDVRVDVTETKNFVKKEKKIKYFPVVSSNENVEKELPTCPQARER